MSEWSREGVREGENKDNYWDAFFQAENSSERIFCMVAMYVGTVVFGTLLSEIENAVSQVFACACACSFVCVRETECVRALLQALACIRLSTREREREREREIRVSRSTSVLVSVFVFYLCLFACTRECVCVSVCVFMCAYAFLNV